MGIAQGNDLVEEEQQQRWRTVSACCMLGKEAIDSSSEQKVVDVSSPYRAFPHSTSSSTYHRF